MPILRPVRYPVFLADTHEQVGFLCLEVPSQVPARRLIGLNVDYPVFALGQFCRMPCVLGVPFPEGDTEEEK